MTFDVSAFLNSVASVIVWAFIGVLLLLGATWLFDRIYPIDFDSAIEKGNIAAAIFFGSIVLGISLIIFAAVR